MKVVILAGGFGTRISEESHLRPKPMIEIDGGYINGGFMVFSPSVFDYLTDDATILEQEPFENMAKDAQLMSYKHEGFWQCMDTQRDKEKLEQLMLSGEAPWKKW